MKDLSQRRDGILRPLVFFLHDYITISLFLITVCKNIIIIISLVTLIQESFKNKGV